METEEYFNEGTPFKSMKPALQQGDVVGTTLFENEMTPKQFLEKQDDGYIAGDYTPNEVYSLMEDYAKLKIIEENKSILAMAELHMDERAVLVLKQRIFDLERQS